MLVGSVLQTNDFTPALATVKNVFDEAVLTDKLVILNIPRSEFRKILAAISAIKKYFEFFFLYSKKKQNLIYKIQNAAEQAAHT